MRTDLELPGLHVSVPDPARLFAMKVRASRPEDRPDLESLIARLGIRTRGQALAVVGRFYPLDRLPIIGTASFGGVAGLTARQATPRRVRPGRPQDRIARAALAARA